MAGDNGTAQATISRVTSQADRARVKGRFYRLRLHTVYFCHHLRQSIVHHILSTMYLNISNKRLKVYIYKLYNDQEKRGLCLDLSAWHVVCVSVCLMITAIHIFTDSHEIWNKCTVNPR